MARGHVKGALETRDGSRISQSRSMRRKPNVEWSMRFSNTVGSRNCCILKGRVRLGWQEWPRNRNVGPKSSDRNWKKLRIAVVMWLVSFQELEESGPQLKSRHTMTSFAVLLPVAFEARSGHGGSEPAKEGALPWCTLVHNARSYTAVPIPSSNARDSFYHQSFLTASPQMLDENTLIIVSWATNAVAPAPTTPLKAEETTESTVEVMVRGNLPATGVNTGQSIMWTVSEPDFCTATWFLLSRRTPWVSLAQWYPYFKVRIEQVYLSNIRRYSPSLMPIYQ